MKILVTGGCGFLGHHFVEHLIKTTDWDIVVLDKLTYAANGFDRLRDIEVFDDKRVRCFTHDMNKQMSVGIAREIGNVDYIVHLAAETHVDNSITDPEPFIKANVMGTFHVLEFAKTIPTLQKMVYFSTDEIFGPAPENIAYKEWDRYNSTNPYSASKAGGEELCLAWANTYKTPVLITHTMNIFGERQHPEKFIPMTIKKILNDEIITIHANKELTKAGSRFWIHARNVANAIMFILNNGEVRDKYNIVGEKELDNLEIAKFIADVMGKTLRYKMVDFHSSRPGHDLRYALDGKKMEGMGWAVPMSFEKSLEKTIKWFVKNQKWLKTNGGKN